jgi:hypothetical protein
MVSITGTKDLNTLAVFKESSEGDYWLPPPIIRTTPIGKTDVDPEHWEDDGNNHQ